MSNIITPFSEAERAAQAREELAGKVAEKLSPGLFLRQALNNMIDMGSPSIALEMSDDNGNKLEFELHLVMVNGKVFDEARSEFESAMPAEAQEPTEAAHHVN